MKWISCVVTITVFWTTAVPTVGNLCGNRTFCRISELDITSTAEILNVLGKETSITYITIEIQRLIMGSTTFATLLVKASAITSNLLFKKYHETMLFLPSSHTLEVLTLHQARKLQLITIQTNRHLRQLEITRCAISIVPPSISNLLSLRELRLNFCSIKTLNLALLATLKYLETVQLVGNSIGSIYAPQAAIVQNIRRVDLSYNKLRQLDMSVFSTLKLVNNLNLANNQISTIDYPPGRVVTLSRLTSLSLANNRIERMSFVQLNASNLEFLVLSFNRLATIPEHIGKFANLIQLAIANNGLDLFNFTILQRLSNLQTLELQNNRLRSIDLPREVLLPSLNQLSLSNNQLKSVALEQLIAPRLSIIDLSNNRLLVIPNVFEKDVRQLQYLNIMDNPLVCSTYEQYRKYIRAGIIIPKWLKQHEDLCSTGKYFILNKTKRACCTT